VMNLFALHPEFGSLEAMVMRREAATEESGRGEKSKAPAQPAKEGRASRKDGGEVETRASSDRPSVVADVPGIFARPAAEMQPGGFAHPPDDVFAGAESVPLERWLFGQYNKLLPAKATCRALLNLLADTPDGLAVGAAGTTIAEAAAHLGDVLSRHDERHNLCRRDALAVGFPSSGPKGDKGRLRYASQFVAAVNAHGQLSGLPFGLKLLNVAGSGGTKLLLTEMGIRFACMENPVLDGSQSSSPQKFTSKETDFLLQHISSSVPVEDFAYRTVLSVVLEGANTPSHADDALRAFISPEARERVTKAFLSTQRSGAVSRMVDLDLLWREHAGTRVCYVPTERGAQYVRENGKGGEGSQ